MVKKAADFYTMSTSALGLGFRAVIQRINSRDMGLTFQSDIIQANGNIASSALDHIYVSNELESKTKTITLKNSSTDHLPIMAKINKQKLRTPKMKTITRRSTKNYSKGSWNAALERNILDHIQESDKLEEMTSKLNDVI